MALRRRKMMGTGISRLRTVPLPVGVFGVPPVSGYVGWYDALDPSTVTVSESLVSNWADKSGNGNDLVQATTANKPSFGFFVMNGLPGLYFDGTNDVLTNGTISASDRTMSTFAAVCILGLAAANPIRGSSASGGNEFRVEVTTGLLTTNRSTVDLLAAMSTPAVTAGVPFVAGQVLTDTDITHYLNGANETDANSSNFTAARTLRVGQNQGGSTAFARMILSELLIYDTSLSSSDALSVIGYLMSKWGIT